MNILSAASTLSNLFTESISYVLFLSDNPKLSVIVMLSITYMCRGSLHLRHAGWACAAYQHL